MKKEHKVDQKGRIRPDITVKGFLDKENNKKVIFFEDHMTIICEKDFQNYAKSYEKVIGDPKLARILLAAESIDYSVDSNGRMVIPKEYRGRDLIGKNMYFFTVEDDGVKSVEIYEKSVYESIVSKYYSADKKGLKNPIKGNER